MPNYFRFILSICSWVTLVWVFGCSEQSPQTSEVSAEDIVGDPIVEITEETFWEENQSLAVRRESNETVDSEEILQEGIVIKGRAQPETDGNQTQEIIESNLPPLEEGSEYKPLAFRDMMNFEYWSNGKKMERILISLLRPAGAKEVTGKSEYGGCRGLHDPPC